MGKRNGPCQISTECACSRWYARICVSRKQCRPWIWRKWFWPPRKQISEGGYWICLDIDNLRLSGAADIPLGSKRRKSSLKASRLVFITFKWFRYYLRSNDLLGPWNAAIWSRACGLWTRVVVLLSLLMKSTYLGNSYTKDRHQWNWNPWLATLKSMWAESLKRIQNSRNKCRFTVN